jgi:glycosyltransferase involved in cell wall biosynthesis
MTPEIPRVGFDVSALVRPHSRGVARAAQGLTRAVEERGVLEVVRLAPEGGRSLRRWRQVELPRAARERGLLGIHSFTSAFPLRGPGRRVQTIHEVPWLHGVREGSDLGHRLWTRLGPLRADRVVVPSRHTAEALARVAPLARRRIAVVPWGVDARFAPGPPAGEVDEVVLDRYRLGSDPFLLVLDGGREKKNLDLLLAGVAEWKRAGGARLEIVVAGRETPALRRSLGLVSRLGLAGWVTTLEEIEEQDLPALYRLAALVPVLSASEGFAFPVAEALACGTSVLVPPGSAQVEVAAEAGIGVDPASPQAIAAGIERALAERDSRREARVARGAAFPWSRAAELVERLWQELA